MSTLVIIIIIIC